MSCPTSYKGAVLADGYCADTWASGVNGVRGLWIDDGGDVLALARSDPYGEQIVALWDSDGDGKSTDSQERVQCCTVTALYR